MHFVAGFAAGTIWLTISCGYHGDLSRGRHGAFLLGKLAGFAQGGPTALLKMAGVAAFCRSKQEKTGCWIAA